MTTSSANQSLISTSGKWGNNYLELIHSLLIQIMVVAAILTIQIFASPVDIVYNQAVDWTLKGIEL